MCIRDRCTTFFEVFTMLCAMLDGSITAHCALALPTANRHRQIISVILVLMLLWILVDFIIYCSPIGWSGFGFTRT